MYSNNATSMAFNVYKLYSHVMSSVCSHEWASLALVVDESSRAQIAC
jgi:hypothetical protein